MKIFIDTKDRPLLRAAIMADVDVIVTGDKDFLEAGIEWPAILSPAEFMSYDCTDLMQVVVITCFYNK